jgi:hypothetical protein
MTVSHVAEAVWRLALIALAIATTATAVVQLLKDLLPVRRWFQRSFLNTWFWKRLEERSIAMPAADFKDAEADLIHLATGGDYNAFYDLETAQLCGQMNSAAQAALAYPNRHPNLLRYLAPEADFKDIDIVTATADPDSAKNPDVPVGQPEGGNALLDARNRLAHHLQRSIDALQISMSFRWKLIVQILVYCVCLGASFTSVYAVNSSAQYNFVEALTIGIVAGFLSPVFSDLAAVINRLRKP